MRLKKGSKVEVFSRRDIAVGSWVPAQVLSRNDNSYAVKFNYPHQNREMAWTVVRRKVVRPCPPSIEAPVSWIPGDVVDVFENNSWQLAEVCRVVGGNFFDIRKAGCYKIARVHLTDLRAPLVFKNGEWFFIKKIHEDQSSDSSAVDGGRMLQSLSAYMDNKLSSGKNNNHEESRSRNLKRRLNSSPVDRPGVHGYGYKRPVFADSLARPSISRHPYLTPEKVPVVASPCMSLRHRYRTNIASGNYVGISSVHEGDDDNISTGSSVGSSSPCFGRSSCRYDPVTDQILSSSRLYCQDALLVEHTESEDEFKDIVHQMELQAFTTTLSALHALGPLSWDKELLVTNLRMELHISNDEHLKARVGG